MTEERVQEETMLVKALALPMPENYFTGELWFQVFSEAWGFVNEGVANKDDLETVLLMGTQDTSLDSVLQATTELRRQLAIYSQRVQAILEGAVSEQSTLQVALEKQQRSVQAEHEAFLADVDGYVDEYTNLRVITERIIAYFEKEFDEATAKAEKTAKPNRWTQVTRPLAILKQHVEDRIYVSEEASEMTEAEEEQLVQDITAVDALIRIVKQKDRILDKVKWSLAEMATLVTGANAEFARRIAEGGQLKAEEDRNFQMISAQTEGGMGAARSALQDVNTKKETIETAVQELQAKTQSVQEVLIA